MKGFRVALAGTIKAGAKIQTVEVEWMGSTLAVAFICGTKEYVRDPRHVG